MSSRFKRLLSHFSRGEIILRKLIGTWFHKLMISPDFLENGTEPRRTEHTTKSWAFWCGVVGSGVSPLSFYLPPSLSLPLPPPLPPPPLHRLVLPLSLPFPAPWSLLSLHLDFRLPIKAKPSTALETRNLLLSLDYRFPRTFRTSPAKSSLSSSSFIVLYEFILFHRIDFYCSVWFYIIS